MGRAHPQGAVTRLCVRYLEAARRRFPQSNGHHDGRATASIFPPMAWIFPRALPSSRSQRRRRTTRETTQTSQFRPFPSPLRSNSRHPRGCGDDTPTGSGPRSPGVAETPHPPGCATTGTRRFAYGDGAEATATVTGCGENLISVAWPDELSVLPDGTEVSIVVIRTSGSATYVSTPRSAIVVG